MSNNLFHAGVVVEIQATHFVPTLPANAGKTTLLDVLAGRKNSGTMAGEMYLRGHPKDSKTFNRLAVSELCYSGSLLTLNLPEP